MFTEDLVPVSDVGDMERNENEQGALCLRGG